MCVQRSAYPAFYLTTIIFESRNQVCKRFIYFSPKLSYWQAERYSAFRSGELSSQLFRGPFLKDQWCYRHTTTAHETAKKNPAIWTFDPVSNRGMRSINCAVWREQPWWLREKPMAAAWGRAAETVSHIWSTSHWWRLAQPHPKVTAHGELQ